MKLTKEDLELVSNETLQDYYAVLMCKVDKRNPDLTDEIKMELDRRDALIPFNCKIIKDGGHMAVLYNLFDTRTVLIK